MLLGFEWLVLLSYLHVCVCMHVHVEYIEMYWWCHEPCTSLLLLYSAQLQDRVGRKTSMSQEEKQKNTPMEAEQCQEKEEKEKEEDVKRQTKQEENKERVDNRVTETFL